MKVKMTKPFKCYLNETEYNDLKKDQEIDVNEKDYNFLVNKKGVAELVKVVKKEIKKEVPVKDEVKETPAVKTENVQEKETPEEKAEVPKKEADKKDVPKKGRKAGRKPRK